MAQHMAMDMFWKRWVSLSGLNGVFFQYIADAVTIHFIMISVRDQGTAFQCSRKLAADISINKGCSTF